MMKWTLLLKREWIKIEFTFVGSGESKFVNESFREPADIWRYACREERLFQLWIEEQKRIGTRMTPKERIIADKDFLGLKIRKDNSGLPAYEWWFYN